MASLVARQQPLLRRFLTALDHVQSSVHPAKHTALQQHLREASPDPTGPDGGLAAMSDALAAVHEPAWIQRYSNTLRSLGGATELWLSLLSDGALPTSTLFERRRPWVDLPPIPPLHEMYM